ncbi:MAG: AAA family ATPase [Phycisphaerae bacterium]|nr:AAA family ATPase [Phycisphaerae bacterium]
MTARESLAQYVAVCWEPDDLIELRPLPPEQGRRDWIRAGDLADLVERLVQENTQGANLFAGVLPRTAEGGGTDKDCGPGRVVWADFDGCDPREAWRRAVATGMPEPSMAISSGHGAHLFWRLTEPVDPERLSKLVGNVAAMIGSDPTVRNPSRILRLPGFVNWKEPKADAVLLFADPTVRYPIGVIEKVINKWKLGKALAMVQPLTIEQDAPDAVKRAQAYVDRIAGQAEGERNTKGFEVAAVLVNDFRLSPETAWPMLREWNLRNRPPLAEKELRAVLASGSKYAKGQPGAKLQAEPTLPEVPEIVRVEHGGLTAMQEEIAQYRRGELASIELPWSRLSDLARPLQPGTVLVIAGPTNTGKSLFVMRCAEAVHLAGYPWKYLPLEDRRMDFFWRWLAIRTSNFRLLNDDPEAIDLREAALKLYGDEIERLHEFVCQNPRVGWKDEHGKTIVPPLPYTKVLDWMAEALKTARVVFVDPISQIEFDGRDPWKAEADFMRQALALANDSGGTVCLVAHTIKRPGKAASQPLTIDDIQGSAMIGRLCHVALLIDVHDPKTSKVHRLADHPDEVEHDRTLILAKVRNGPGARQRLAFAMDRDAPVFRELGLIVPKKTAGRGAADS